MNRRELETCLQNALKPDTATRKMAESRILEMQAQSFRAFVMVLSEIFCDAESDGQFKMMTGIILKNSLHANDAELQRTCEDRWIALQHETREYIKDMFRKALRGAVPRFCTMAGAVLGQIARTEISRGLYLDFFEEMKRMVCDEDAACGVCEAVGVCCNYLIEECVDIGNLCTQTVFDICMHPLENGRGAAARLASLKCFMNSVEIQDVFHHKENVERFLGATVGIWNGGDEELIHKSMICFNRLVVLNYRFVQKDVLENMLAQYLGRFFKSGSEDIRVQAIEYWCIFVEKRDEQIVDKYLAAVTPEILGLLEKGPNYHEEMWSPHKAAASCLEMYTEMKGSMIMKSPVVRSFVWSALKSGDGMRMDVGAVALGSVMSAECEDHLVDFVPHLVAGIDFKESKDSCLWALSRIAECNFYSLVNHFQVLMDKCGGVVMEGSRFSVGAAWVMDCIFSAVAESRSEGFAQHISTDLRRKADGFIDQFFVKQYLDILNVLIKGTEVASLDDSNLRVALFSALTELVLICPQPIANILDEFYLYTAKKIEECLGVMGCATQNQLLIIEDVLSNYIGLIEAIAGARSRRDVDDLVVLFGKILNSTPTIAFGEVYIAMSKLSAQFSPHMSAMLPCITRDMTCTDRFVLKSVVNLVGTLASAMGSDFNILATVLTPSLVQCLSAESTPRDLKPMVLSVFGDVALALERNFEPYVEMVVTLLSQIAGLGRRADEEFVDDLRRNVVQLVDCVFMAVGDSLKMRSLLPQIVEMIRRIQAEDVDRVSGRSILGLIDDLVSVYGKNFGLDEPWVRDFLYGMEKHGGDKDRRKASHALDMLR